MEIPAIIFNKLLSENSLKFQIERTYLKKEDIEKQEFEKKEQEELQKKQTLIKEFSIISSISIKEAIQLLMKKLVKIAKQRKKEEEERRIKELENAEALKKEIKAHQYFSTQLFGSHDSKGYWPAECAFSERIIKT